MLVHPCHSDGLNILNWLVKEKIDKCCEKKHTRRPKQVTLSFEIKDERKQSKNDWPITTVKNDARQA
jgi:hypothetical protein